MIVEASHGEVGICTRIEVQLPLLQILHARHLDASRVALDCLAMRPRPQHHLAKLERRHVAIRHIEHFVYRFQIGKVHFVRGLGNNNRLCSDWLLLRLFLRRTLLAALSLAEIQGGSGREDCGGRSKSDDVLLIYR